jgi:D-3-phosphoglycerate dehydrogenase / 2-oxoglutarate reductase
MTVGLVGYGEVGRRVVKFLKAFGCRILVSDPYVQLTAEDLREGITQCSFDTLLAEADVITLHARVTAETTKMINEETLRRMKPNATLINTARGPLLDYDALYRVMSEGHLRGAMLETFAIEPVPPDWPLLQLPNVTLTPHIAGASVHTVRYAAGLAAEEVRRYLAGEPAVNRC